MVLRAPEGSARRRPRRREPSTARRSLILDRPVTTLVVAMAIMLAGLVALWQMPVQLTPSIEAPILQVTTLWPDASPAEIEREIVLRQEEQLGSLPGLMRMDSSCNEGMGSISLSFSLDTDLDAAMILVNNRLQQVRDRPEDAERPILETVGSDGNNIAWFMLQPGGREPFEGDITTLGALAEDVIEPRLERLPGVARSTIFGARSERLEVRVDAAALAARGLTHGDVAQALDRDARSWSGGDAERGDQRVLVRTISAFERPEDVAAVVIAERGGVPVTVADIAEVALGHRESKELGFFLGRPAIGVAIQKKVGANVLEVMTALRAEVSALNHQVLAPRGLRLTQTYDETDYISSAVLLVRQSLLIGGLLAIVVLWLFLRSRAGTLVVAATIPISLLGACFGLWITGRTINVLTLAGLAFAVGMVVDNSIVVLENIYRHRVSGVDRRTAALCGLREVRGAIIASTATTVAVFVPIALLGSEAGQMFRDLAFAIAFAVSFSLLVSLTVVPSLAIRSLEKSPSDRRGRLKGIDRLARRAGERISHGVYRLAGDRRWQIGVVVIVTLVSIGGTVLLAPAAEYLPAGNRNFLVGSFQPPAGSTIDRVAAYQGPLAARMAPLWAASTDRAAAMPGGGVRSFYFVAAPSFGAFGIVARDPDRVRELIPEVQAALDDVADADGHVVQRSVFENSYSGDGGVDLDLFGPDLDHLHAAAALAVEKIESAMPEVGAYVSPHPQATTPELHVLPDAERLVEVGLRADDVGLAVASLVDGVPVADYVHHGREIEVVLTHGAAGGPWPDLEFTSIATPTGQVVSLGSVSRQVQIDAPASLRRLDRQRVVSVHIQPAAGTGVDGVVERLKQEVLPALSAAGHLDAVHTARLGGSAGELANLQSTLALILLLAVVVIYLLMAALFESFVLPAVILWSVPLASLGGILGLRVMDWATPDSVHSLDILTMLGFLILIGTVVNNAILLVYQTLQHRRRHDMSVRDAVTAAARNRMRPIFMSVSTSIFGMLPLVLFPGAGAELYRGLGAVVVGGLAVSTVLTLAVVPALLCLVLGAQSPSRQRFRLFGDDSSRFDLVRPSSGDSSGTMAAVDPSGTLDL